jgi:hypothetical protein
MEEVEAAGLEASLVENLDTLLVVDMDSGLGDFAMEELPVMAAELVVAMVRGAVLGDSVVSWEGSFSPSW